MLTLLDSSMISMGPNSIQLPPLDPGRPAANRTSNGEGQGSFQFNFPTPNPASPHNAQSPLGPSFRPSNSPLTPFNKISEADQPRQSTEFASPPHLDSRRSSFDTRLGNLALGPSPIGGTPNASQVSLTSTLQRERGIPLDGKARSSYHSGNTPYPASTSSTLNPSSANRGPFAAERSKVAPQIAGATRFPYPHPNAPSPTPGFPYAFPDPDLASPPGSADGTEKTKPPSLSGLRQRNNSIDGSSIASSIVSYSSTLPPGQKRLGDNLGVPSDAQSQRSFNSNTESFQSLSSQSLYHGSAAELAGHHHHHHQLQHKQLSGLIGEPQSPTSGTPYSRTPELRVSHKMAERKRRSEMKGLFDELRDIMPQERGGKCSKWEVLTKGKPVIRIHQIHHKLTCTQPLNTLLVSRPLTIVLFEQSTFIIMNSKHNSGMHKKQSIICNERLINYAMN
jgi:Helix-loop-helix DNA-binding domain